MPKVWLPLRYPEVARALATSSGGGAGSRSGGPYADTARCLYPAEIRYTTSRS